MSDLPVFKNISSTIAGCTKNVKNLKKIIGLMISDSSIYTTQSNTLEKSLSYIDGNINTLENLFSSVDAITDHKDIRKKYVILIEDTILDFTSFKQKLDKIKLHNINMKELADYLENTRI